MNKSASQPASSANNKVWVFGKARLPVWDKQYADHLESLGYQVKRSLKNPANEQ